MESRGITLGTVFRARYKLPQETDVFELIQAAMTVAYSEKTTEELMKKRLKIAETILFAKPEFEFDHDDIECGGDGGKSTSTKYQSTIDNENHSSTNGDANKRRTRSIDVLCKDAESTENLDPDSNKRRRRVTDAPCKDVGKSKKLDQDSVETKLKASINKMHSRYQEIRKNRAKIQLLDAKSLPQPQSKCKVTRLQKFRKTFYKEQQIRRQLMI